MSEPINFDRAEYVEVSSLNCQLCREPLRFEYFDMGGATICAMCRDKIEAGRAAGGGPHRFIRAVGFGFVAATVGSVIYALIVKLIQGEIGLMAIVLGYMIGRSVSVGSYHRGGRRYQILAMLLTYMAICARFIPSALEGLTKLPTVVAAVAAFVISLGMPFLILFNLGKVGFSGIIAIFIMGIGIYEAWKLNKRGVRGIAGPFPISPSPSGSTIVVG